MFSKKFWTIAVPSLLILAALVIISYSSSRPVSDAGYARKLLLEALWPLESLKNKAIKSLHESWSRYLFLVGLEKENRQLKKDIQVLENKLIQYREGYLKSLQLQSMLELREKFDERTVIAEVIDREYSSVFKSVLINKGTVDGLRAGLPVLSDQGIAGRITECSRNACRAMLVTDVNSKISVLLQHNRTHGILQGVSGTRCRLKYIPKAEDVKTGDVVVSSGLGGIFPKGHVLGVVTVVDKKEGGLFQRIDVQPSVDFDKLEFVAIIAPQEALKH
jgi:rod shape-determining protein MreC